MKQSINVFSLLWGRRDSYGRLANEIARGLEEQGFYVNCFGPDAPSRPIIPTFGGIYVSPAHAMHEFAKEFFQLMKNGPLIGLSMFEATHVPPHWIQPLNTFSHFIVPSQFLLDIFMDNGVTTPMRVIPLGVSDVYKKPMRRHAQRITTFYATGDSGMRKGWWEAGQAFLKVFGNSKEHRLIYKARTHNMPFSLANDNISVIHGEWSDRAMLQFYHSVDAMMFPTLGEGFGWPPREFAASGGPVITTNWGGTKDDIDQWGWSLKIEGLQRAWVNDLDYSELGGRWAKPSVDALAEWLQWFVDHKEEAFDKAMEHAENVRKLYGWDRFTSELLEVWKEASEAYDGNRRPEAVLSA